LIFTGIKLTFRREKPDIQSPDEYRILNLGQLSTHVQDISLHAAQCFEAVALSKKGEAPIQLMGVQRDQGLACILQSVCKGCKQTFTIRSSPMTHTPQGKHFDINVRAVWGEAAAGGGATKLSERLTTMGMPGMSGKNKIQTVYKTYKQCTIYCLDIMKKIVI